MAKRAGRKTGWQTLTFTCRGQEVTRRYKTFLATSQSVGGVIRVVLLEQASGNWAAYFSTDVDMDAKTILETGADRWAIEEHFHDVKEVWGAGQQQVRNVWSNAGKRIFGAAARRLRIAKIPKPESPSCSALRYNGDGSEGAIAVQVERDFLKCKKHTNDDKKQFPFNAWVHLTNG